MNDSINRNAPISHRARKAQRCVHEFTIHNGFSLIELMIVLVIVAILASVGSTYYGNYVISANRTEARSALTITAGRLEKCKALYGSYNNANCSVTLPFNTELCHELYQWIQEVGDCKQFGWIDQYSSIARSNMHINKLEEKSIVDIGAGAGYFAFEYAQLADKVIATELNDQLIQYRR